jgi:DNA-binding CsgD family transcriptional regulator
MGQGIRPAESLPTFAAFETVLGMIPQPTFVIGRDGRILQANPLGEEILGRERATIQRSPARVAQGESEEGDWRLTAIGGAPRPEGFIAVLEPTTSGVQAIGGQNPAASLWNLTARQAEVLDLAARGTTNAAVGEALGIKERTVEFHLSAIFDKAGVDNRATLIARLLAL